MEDAMDKLRGFFFRQPDPAEANTTFWISDNSCTVCYDCDTPFTLLVRRHHCRLCGRIFCGRCAAVRQLPVIPSATAAPPPAVRVCQYCFQARLRLMQARMRNETDEAQPDDLPLLVRPSGHSGGDLGLPGHSDVDSDTDTESDSEAAAADAAAEGARRAELDPLGAGIPTSIVPDVFVRSPLPAGAATPSGSGRSGGGGSGRAPSPSSHPLLGESVAGSSGRDSVLSGASGGTGGGGGGGGSGSGTIGGGSDGGGAGGSFKAAMARVSWGSTQVANSLLLPSFAAAPLAGRPPKHPSSLTAADAAAAARSGAGPRSGEEAGPSAVPADSVDRHAAAVEAGLERAWSGVLGDDIQPSTSAAGGGTGATAAGAPGGFPPRQPSGDWQSLAPGRASFQSASSGGGPGAGSAQWGRILDSPDVWRLPPAAEASEATASAAACRSALREASARHLRSSLSQLLRLSGLESDTADEWAPIVAQLAEAAAAAVSPSAAGPGYPMDPRVLIQVKRVPSGKRGDSHLVAGVVCRKNVAHRRMASGKERPRLLLLGGALEYARVQGRLSSLDTLLEQERAHLRAAVARVAAMRPDVVLVESSVARFAQELLLQAGLTLVLNCKPSSLARLARATGAVVAPGPDRLAEARLGCCGQWRCDAVREEHSPAGAVRTLMRFDACPVPLAATVLLFGAAPEELSAVKPVVQWAVLAAHSARLECAALGDLLAAASVCPEEAGDSVQAAAAEVARGWGEAASSSSVAADSPPVPPFSPFEARGSGGAVAGALPGEAPERARQQLLQWGGRGAPPPAPPASAGGKARGQWVCALLKRDLRLVTSASCHHPQRRSLCEPPGLRALDAYEPGDVPLGQFLAAALPAAGRRCPVEGCGEPPEAHERSYCTGGWRLRLRVRAQGTPAAEQGWWHWARCCACAAAEAEAAANASSGDTSASSPAAAAAPWPQGPRVPLSPAALQLSLARFLALSFRAREFHGACGHCLLESSLRFFACNQGTVCLALERCPVLRLAPPPRLARRCAAAEREWLAAEAAEVRDAVSAASAELRTLLQQAADDPGTHSASAGGSGASTAAGGAGVSASPPGPLIHHHQRISSAENPVVGEELGVLAGGGGGSGAPPPPPSPGASALHALEATLEQQLRALAAAAASLGPPPAPGSGGCDDASSAAQRAAAANGGAAGHAHGHAHRVSPLEANRVRRALAATRRTWAAVLAEAYAGGWPAAQALLDSGAGRLAAQVTSSLVPAASAAAAAAAAQPAAAATAAGAAAAASPDAAGAGSSSADGAAASMSVSVATGREAAASEQHAAATTATAAPRPIGASDSAASIGGDGAAEGRLERAPSTSGSLPSSTGRHSATGAGHGRKPAANSLPSAQVQLSPLPGLGRALLPTGADGLCVAVFDDEPTSAIALCLASREYAAGLAQAREAAAAAAAASAGGGGGDTPQQPQQPQQGGIGGRGSAFGSTNSLASSMGGDGGSSVGGGGGGGGEPSSASAAAVDREALSWREAACVRVAWEEKEQQACGTGPAVRCTCVVHFAPQFEALRAASGVSLTDFCVSLSRCRPWAPGGGKSGAFMARTRDERLIAKSLSRVEMQGFLELLPAYFRHVAGAMQGGTGGGGVAATGAGDDDDGDGDGDAAGGAGGAGGAAPPPPSLLARILGLFSLHIKEGGPRGRETRLDLVVQENVFCGWRPATVYDLKGSVRSRYAAAREGVLLDENLLEEMGAGALPLLVGEADAALLRAGARADSDFLSGQGVMDYSLLVGVDPGSGAIAVGIIDYLRQYTWDKQLETVVKASSAALLPGGGGKEPTIISPGQYARRFRRALGRYFVVAPTT